MLERHGVRTTIIRMPANFPPSGTATRELSGMGTPDMLGTYGTFSFFSSSPGPLADRTLSGGRVVAVDVVDNVVRGELVGPDNPFRTPARKVTAPFTVYLDPREAAAQDCVGDEERVLKVGEWSDWVPIEFPLMPFQRSARHVPLLSEAGSTVFELYVSRSISTRPRRAMPISTPASYAGRAGARDRPLLHAGDGRRHEGAERSAC